MAKMKDSGVEWIGEIPEEWEVKRLKALATENDSLFMDGDWIESDVIEEKGVRYLTTGNIGTLQFIDNTNSYVSKENCAKLDCLYVFPGDLAISRLNEPLGRSCIIPAIEDKYIVAVDIVIFRPNKEIYKQYLNYCMNVELYNKYVLNYSSGTTMSRISRTSLGNLYVPCPPIEIQQKISTYLDHKCAQIDAILATIQQSIEKLKEYRQAVITRAITKGLDPNARMKDSGVEWIGEIPAGWEVTSLKNIATVSRGGSPRPIEEYITYEEDGLNWIKIGDTKKGYKFIDRIRQKIRKEGLSKTRMVFKGDLLLTNSMSFGEPYILNIDGCIHDGWVCLQQIKIDKIFLYYLLASNVCMEQFNILTSGGVVQNLNINKIGSITICLPSLEDQQKISTNLDQKCAQIDALISEKQKLHEKITAYKKSLIYEYVTGKSEVPDGWTK